MKRNRVLYLEIADELREAIYAGVYPLNSMLPTETELEKKYQVSKITIRKAIELLAADEYVEKKSGKGTTVINNRPYNKLSRAASFTDILERSDKNVEKKTLDFQTIKLTKDDPMFQYFGTKALYLSRTYAINQQPFIYIQHFLPGNVKKIDQKNFADFSLYRLLHSNGFEIERFKDSFSAIVLTEEQKKILQTDSQIALQRNRQSIDFDGKVVEYSLAIYDTTAYPYEIEYET
ncbi:GntR family transcriptional regulator [Enterococcus sp. LJL120]